jgi:hypothetical protein
MNIVASSIKEQFIRCMADGEIVAWRVSKDYESAAIDWRGEKLLLSTSFVLVKHYIQPGDTEESGLTFFTLYMNLAPYAAYKQQAAWRTEKWQASSAITPVRKICRQVAQPENWRKIR